MNVCERPIFVIGAPRSGKTTLAWALAAHDEMWTSAESQILPPLYGERRVEQLVERQLSRPTPTWLSLQEVDVDEFLAYVGLGLNALFTNRSEGKRWIDHTPDHTFMVDTLLRMFPGAFVIHVIRDGRLSVQAMLDVVEALGPERAKAMREGNFLPRWTTDFEQACKKWASSVAEGMSACARHPEQSVTVLLEDLRTEPEATLRRVLAEIGASEDSAPADSWKWQAKKHEDALMTAEEQWDAWSAERQATFAREAGAVLIGCGLASEADLNGAMASMETADAGKES